MNEGLVASFQEVVKFVESGFHRSLLYHTPRETQQILLIIFIFVLGWDGVTSIVHLRVN